MPPRKKKEDHNLPKPLLKATIKNAVAIEVEGLQGLHFIGIDQDKARQNLLSGLARRYPQGYELVFKDERFDKST